MSPRAPSLAGTYGKALAGSLEATHSPPCPLCPLPGQADAAYPPPHGCLPLPCPALVQAVQPACATEVGCGRQARLAAVDGVPQGRQGRVETHP